MFSFMHYGQESKVKMDVKTTVVDSVEVPKINLDSLGFKPSNQMIDEDKFWAII